VEKALFNAKHVASFIGHEPGRALFVGVYELRGTKSVSFEQYWKIPANVVLKKYGMCGMQPDRKKITWFDLVLMDFRCDWKGKLVIQWPGKELSWWRWADRNEFFVDAIAQESLLDSDMPEWRELVLNWQRLRALPLKWQHKMSQWRGIYFILDVSDGKGYVGAAYGQDNLLHRWLDYAKSGHGDNKLLRSRKPENLRFSILQILPHDMEPAEVQALEVGWKKRLPTREHGLNSN
ncbi:MAG TPA: GIY-YIG nuclease family protein, partial [Pirellulales bacterium]|nr:GIY-YIG nuclease family protein [Pirellulales bacterium]